MKHPGGVPSDVRRGGVFFYLVLPVLTSINLGLGLTVLLQLGPRGWVAWLELATGSFCLVVAGWLGASGWSRWFWGRAMSAQVSQWNRLAAVIFGWLEEAPIPKESIKRLERKLNSTLADGPVRP